MRLRHLYRKWRMIRPGIRKMLIAIAVMVPLVVIYQLITQPAFVEKQVQSFIESNTDAKIDLHVIRASMFYGFEIQDLYLRTNTGIPIFKADSLQLSLFLPGFLSGHVGIREFKVINPVVYIIKTGDSFNFNAIFHIKDDREKPDSILPEIINLYLPFKFYANISINNLSVHYSSIDDTTSPSLEVKHINLLFAFITKTFRKLPLTMEILDIFDTIVLAANPFNPINIDYENIANIKGSAVSGLVFFKESGTTKTEFLSRLKIETDELRAIRSGLLSFPLDYNLYYDTSYDSETDTFLLNKFSLQHDSKPLLNIRARVERVSTNERHLELSILDSIIDLDNPGRIFNILRPQGSSPLNLGGQISIESMNIRGSMEQLRIDGKILGNHIRFSSGNTNHYISNLDLDLNGGIDLYRILRTTDQPVGYDKNRRLAFRIFHYLNIRSMKGYYNGALIDASGRIEPETGIHLTARISNLLLDPFSSPYFMGKGFALLNFNSTENFDTVRFDGEVGVRNAQYSIQRSRSARNDLALNAAGIVYLTKNNIALKIDRAILKTRNETGDQTGHLDMSGFLKFSGIQDYRIRINSLAIAYDRMHPTLPDKIQFIMRPYRTYLSQGANLKSDFHLLMDDRSTSLAGNLEMGIPFLQIEDLKLKTDIAYSKTSMIFKELSIEALRKTLVSRLEGEMHRSSEGGTWKPNLDFRLSMRRDHIYPIHDQLSMKGNLSIAMSLSDNIARGQINMDNIDLILNSSGCNGIQSQGSKSKCTIWNISNINLNLPFEHNTLDTGKIPFQETFQVVPDNAYGLFQVNNLTINSISSNRTPSGKEVPDPFFVIGREGDNQQKGLKANIEYDNNALMIRRLGIDISSKIENKWKPHGSIRGKNLFIHFADLAPANMEFGGKLKVQNFDLAPYLSGERSNYDGIISADLSLKGKNLDEPLHNTNLRLAVHRLSEDFSGFATRVLVPVPTVAFAANQTLEIPSIELLLKGGLIYTSIKVNQSGIFSRIIRPSGDEIRQERIPLAQFMERARSEVGNISRTKRGENRNVDE